MSLFILDTDTLSLYQRSSVTVREAVSKALAAGDTIALAVITVEEQCTGWIAAMRAARTHSHRAEVSRAFAETVVSWRTFNILPQTEASLARFDALVALKLNVGRMDLRIASIALEVGAAVVTHNSRDFGRVPGLATADWTVPPEAPTAAPAPP